MTLKIEGISGEAGAEVKNSLKSEVEAATPLEKGQEAEPTKPQEGITTTENETTPDPKEELRAELVKRFGEGKSDQELLQEVWKSYRNGETTFSQATEKVKELEELVNQFGGVGALREALKTPPATEPENKLPEKAQKLIDAGYDVNDPIVSLIIDQEIRLEQSNKAIGRSTYNEAVQVFETGLKGIAMKYEYADLDVIRELGYKGAFANMTDSQMWQAIDTLANKQHSKIVGLVDNKTQAKLDELKKLNEKKNLDGQPGGGKPTAPTPRQAFDAAHAQYIKGDE